MFYAMDSVCYQDLINNTYVQLLVDSLPMRTLFKCILKTYFYNGFLLFNGIWQDLLALV